MTPKQEAALRLALEAFEYIEHNYMSLPAPATKALAAIDEALAEQQSGIKQVIELYDSPEQPAQQDYWQEEARRYAQNAEFWRGKYEAATAQQQRRVMWGVDWGRAGDQPCVSIIQRLPNGGIEVLATEYGPPASKPWVVLTQQDIDIAFDDTQEGGGFNEFARAIEAKLREKNA